MFLKAIRVIGLFGRIISYTDFQRYSGWVIRVIRIFSVSWVIRVIRTDYEC